MSEIMKDVASRIRVYGKLYSIKPETSKSAYEWIESASDENYARGLADTFYIDSEYSGGAGLYDLSLYVLGWISSAAASGVVGNFAYDRLSKISSKKPKSSDLSPPSFRHKEDVELLAKLTVMARCAQLGWSAPSFDSLKVSEIRLTCAGGIWQVVLVAGDLTAEIAVASARLSGQSMPVAILRKPNPGLDDKL